MEQTADNELFFFSSFHDEIYKASEVPFLSDARLAKMFSEVSAVFASLQAALSGVDYSFTMAADNVDHDWLRRLRKKYSAVKRFSRILEKEVDRRSRVAELEEMVTELQGELKRLSQALYEQKERATSAQRKLNRVLDHAQRTSLARKHERAKRDAFYSLAKDYMGDTAYKVLMRQALTVADAQVF